MDTKKLRQKILDLAIRGKLVPQDPNDEPASVLLERIRAEKAKLMKDGKIKRGKASGTSDTPHYEQVPFEVPKGWVWTTVEEISSSILYGVSESAKTDGVYKLLRITDIQNNSVDWQNVPYTDFDTKKVEAYLLKDGDILFARTGATVGKSYLVSNLKDDAIYASYLIRVQTFNVILPKYVKSFFESEYYWKQIQCGSVGIGQPNVNGTTLSQLNIPIPPINEQQRIVSEIERWFALIDQIEQSRDDLQTAVKQAKSKILDLAIHGKLVPQDPNDEPASTLLKRINPKAEVVSDNGHYGKLPKGWCYCRLCNVLKITMGQSPEGTSINSDNGIEFHQGKLCFSDKYLRSSNVFTTEPTKTADESSLLLCVRAPVGIVNITERKICIGRGLCSLKPLKGNTDFYFYLLQTLKESFEKQSTGTTFKAISGDVVKNTIVPLPPLAEQQRIVQKIEDLFSVLDNIQKSIEA